MTASRPVLDAAEVRAGVLAEVTAERDDLARRQAEAREALSAVVAEANRIRAEHQAACDDARAAHAKMPPPPDVPDATEAQELVHRLTRETANVADRQARVLASAVPTIEAAWSDARPHLDAEAADLLVAVEALAARYADWWNLLHTARQSAERADPNRRVHDGPSTRMGQRPDVLTVLAAGRGADVCAVTPIPSARVVTEPEDGFLRRGTVRPDDTDPEVIYLRRGAPRADVVGQRVTPTRY